ncbi:hypothetical protein NL676_039002 [Syzygium grande]|nr:hypothetical protein NL676_039002 [Syzygium grande]
MAGAGEQAQASSGGGVGYYLVPLEAELEEQVQAIRAKIEGAGIRPLPFSVADINDEAQRSQVLAAAAKFGAIAVVSRVGEFMKLCERLKSAAGRDTLRAAHRRRKLARKLRASGDPVGARSAPAVLYMASEYQSDAKKARATFETSVSDLRGETRENEPAISSSVAVLRSCFGFDAFFATDVWRFGDGGIFTANLRRPIDEVIPKLESKLSEAAGREVVVWFMEEKADDITKQACVVQPKSEMDWQFESTRLSTPGGIRCLGVVNKYKSLLPNKKALFDILVARTASAYMASLALTIAAFVADGSFNGGDNALYMRPQFFFNNPLLSFIQFIIGPYTDDPGNVLPYAVEGVGVPVDPLAFAGLLDEFLCIQKLIHCTFLC